MSVQIFSFPARIEVAEKFLVVGWWWWWGGVVVVVCLIIVSILAHILSRLKLGLFRLVTRLAKARFGQDGDQVGQGQGQEIDNFKNVTFYFYPWCVQSALFVVKHGQKSKVRTVLKTSGSQLFKTVLTFEFDHVLPEIIQIEHTKDKKKTGPF